MTRRESIGLGVAAMAGAAFSQQKKLRAVVIGHTGRGGYGHNWDLTWNGIDAVEVIAVADPVDAGRAKAMARSGAARGYADYREMLAKEKPDIVVVAPRRSDQHMAMFTAAAEAGAHIIIEKPMAGSLPEADAMVALAEKKHIKVQVGHPARAAAVTRRVAEIIKSGEIGQLIEMRARGKEDKRAGGEDLTILGSHAFDLMRLFAGDPRWVSAHVTYQNQELAREHVRQGMEAVGLLAGDNVAAMFSFDGGIHGYFASRSNDYLAGDRCGLTLCCSRGVIFINLGSSRSGQSFILRSPSWIPNKNAPQWEEIPGPGPEIIGNWDRANNVMALDLLDAIRNGREPVCGIRDGRWPVEMTAGVYQSQLKGGRVAFPLTDRRDPLASL
ncbi:MAG: Gfo/Idh/MocA family oxidoreductase [Bryobacteraceae bacterium]